MDETPNTPTLWNKKAEDLTVSDALKLNGIVLIITIGAIAGISAACVGAEKLSTFRAKRREAKDAAKNNTETVVE